MTEKIYQITPEGRQVLEKDIQRRKLFYQIGEQVFEALGESKMGINKKYLLSLGVAYYPEKEMVRLQNKRR